MSVATLVRPEGSALGVHPAHRAPASYFCAVSDADFGLIGRVAKSMPHAVNKE